MRKIIFSFLFIGLLVFFGIVLGNKYLFKPKNNAVQNVSSNVSDQTNKPEEIVEIPKQDDVPKESVIPDSVLLEIPFMSQAPFQEWDAFHEDACEEASLIMVKYFSDNKKLISKEQGEKEIQHLVLVEEENKYKSSITLNELNEVAEKYYGLGNGRVEKNITIDDIKKELADGKPVIVGAAGKVLPNPNFRNGGPNYHMLVIKGYDEKGFITNDPGTRLGENFRYTFDGLFNAIHDWNAKNILNGGKNYLVFD
ncbi:MAG: C39 family peptidase [Patescibacteria group bacterium]